MKKTYQIDQQRATQRFRKEAGASNEKLQLALPLPEVLALVQRGLMSLALAAFTAKPAARADAVTDWNANTEQAILTAAHHDLAARDLAELRENLLDLLLGDVRAKVLDEADGHG